MRAFEDGHDPWTELALVVADLEQARTDLAAATFEAEAVALEMRHRTAEVHELNDLLDGTMAVCDDAIVVVAVESRRVRAWSGGAERRFGLAARDVVGRTIASVRARGLPSARLADEVGRLARPAPAAAERGDDEGGREGAVATRDGVLRLTAIPADPAAAVRAVVARFIPAGSGLHADPEAPDDAGQPA